MTLYRERDFLDNLIDIRSIVSSFKILILLFSLTLTKCSFA